MFIFVVLDACAFLRGVFYSNHLSIGEYHVSFQKDFDQTMQSIPRHVRQMPMVTFLMYAHMAMSIQTEQLDFRLLLQHLVLSTGVLVHGLLNNALLYIIN